MGEGVDCGALQWEGAVWIWRCCRRGVKPDGFYLSGHLKLWEFFHCSIGFLHDSGLVTVDYCLLFWSLWITVCCFGHWITVCCFGHCGLLFVVLVTVDYCLLFWYKTTFVAFIALLPNF
jgi:hypothetical protein